MMGYLCLAAGVSALAGLGAVLILEVACQHLLALILTVWEPVFKTKTGL